MPTSIVPVPDPAHIVLALEASKGDTGGPGPMGPPGTPGPVGPPLRPKGNVPTYSMLPASGNIANDFWTTADTGKAYVWNDISHSWLDMGHFTGAQGPQGNVGPQGQTGATGAMGPQGPVGAGGSVGPIGQTGPPGPTGAPGPVGPAGDSLPVGAIFMFGSMTPPAGCLPADGRSVNRADYPALFAVFGTSFGAVDGATFNLPDLRSRFIVGAGQGTGLTNRVLAAKGGEELHALTIGELAAHTHGMDHSHNIAAGQFSHTHTASGASHTHGMDHYHNWGAQGSHAHGLSDGGHSHPVGMPAALNYGTTSPGYQFYQCASGTSGNNIQAASGLSVQAAATPAGNTVYASQTSAGWANTGATAPGVTVAANTLPAGATATASATNAAWANTGSNGSGTGHNNMPPFVVLAYMVKALVIGS